MEQPNPPKLLDRVSRRKRRLKDERNFVGCVGFRLALPNLQILAVSQFQLSSLEEAPPTNYFRQFNLRFLPSIVKGGFYQKLAAYGHFGRPDLEILPWESIDQVPALQSAKI